MNKLNIFLSFVLLSFCLLINVSYAELNIGDSFECKQNYNILKISKVGDYTISQIRTILENYKNYPSEESYQVAFNNLITVFSDLGCNNYFFIGTRSSTAYFFVAYPDSCNLYFNYVDGHQRIYLDSVVDSTFYCVNNQSSSQKNTVVSNGIDRIWELYLQSFDSYYSTTKSIKFVDVDKNTIYFNGDYYYQVSTTPGEPSIPSNSEIASVVQSFYDSDLYKNNTNFKDFMVVYNFVTGYYSIIGTDNHLLQEIYYDGAKPSNDDFTYPETWWRFYNYFGNVQNLFYGWDYWLFSTRKENDIFLPIKYDGVGKLNNLFNLKFTNQSVIVYSSYEYEVYEFRPPTQEGGENQVIKTTVPGNEFTYNENLNPTDSNYSPIQNYIPINPSQTILGNVDFDEINKTFEENKDILNIKSASWLFSANNQLVGYFISFLSLLIVFLIISRILGG